MNTEIQDLEEEKRWVHLSQWHSEKRKQCFENLCDQKSSVYEFFLFI